MREAKKIKLAKDAGAAKKRKLVSPSPTLVEGDAACMFHGGEAAARRPFRFRASSFIENSLVPNACHSLLLLLLLRWPSAVRAEPRAGASRWPSASAENKWERKRTCEHVASAFLHDTKPVVSDVTGEPDV